MSAETLAPGGMAARAGQGFGKRLLFLGLAVVVNAAFFLLVPLLQALAEVQDGRAAPKEKEVLRELEFVAVDIPRAQKQILREIRNPVALPEPLSSPRPPGGGGGLKLDLSPAGGDGLALVSGGDRMGGLGSGTGGGQGSGTGPMTYALGMTDTDARLVSDAKPSMPPRAAREGKSGYVVLTFVVNESGLAEQITILQEEPEGYGFASEAIQSAKRLRFKPATLQKTAVRQHFRRRFDFTLD